MLEPVVQLQRSRAFEHRRRQVDPIDARRHAPQCDA
jgi:hypothetical protein